MTKTQEGLIASNLEAAKSPGNALFGDAWAGVIMGVNDMSSIPCVMLAYMRHDAIKGCVESIHQCDPRVDIHVVENPSETTADVNLPYARDALAKGIVQKYILFDENISNNALEIALLDILDDVRESEYIIVGDCDIWVPEGTVDEQISILRDNPHVGAVALQIDVSRWDQKYADILTRYTQPLEQSRKPNVPYLVPGPTGFWFTMFRTSEFFTILDEFRRNGVRFIDGNFQSFGREILGKPWVVTLNSIGRDLNREVHDTAYWQQKGKEKRRFRAESKEVSNRAIYNHDRISSAICLTRSGEIRIPAMPRLRPVARRVKEDWSQDEVLKRVIEGTIVHPVGRFRMKSPRLDGKAGFYFVQNGFHTSLPELNGDKSVIRLRNPRSLPELPPVFSHFSGANILEVVDFEYADSILARLYGMLVPGGKLTLMSYSFFEIARRWSANDLAFFDVMCERHRPSSKSLGAAAEIQPGQVALALASFLQPVLAAYDTGSLMDMLAHHGFENIQVAPVTAGNASDRRYRQVVLAQKPQSNEKPRPAAV